jgi:aminopeptidase-like protein
MYADATGVDYLWSEPDEAMHAMVRDLFPLCRSITGPGLRETIHRIGRAIPLVIHEVPSGTPVLDWNVPDEWTIRAARIETLDGRVLIDFASNNLHVVSYSRPVDAIVTRSELAEHIHTLPDQPDLIPYRTGYFANTWGFCLPHCLWETMSDPEYRIIVDSTIAPGSLTYGELLVPGQSQDEVLISVHCCHPSLANDNLSGIAVATQLASNILGENRRLSYRFLFLPATIGAITWLSRNQEVAGRIKAGLVLTCLGDPGDFHYKRSRQDNAEIDRLVVRVMKDRGLSVVELPFAPFGYDERQYGSPGFNMPVGCFMRSPNGGFPEYHTSADNLSLVRSESLAESLSVLSDILKALDANVVYSRLDGRGEPQLGRRGLYRMISGQTSTGGATQEALNWVLNLADGKHSLLDMSERSNLSFSTIASASQIALHAGLIAEV